jgi:hypothetical protein
MLVAANIFEIATFYISKSISESWNATAVMFYACRLNWVPNAEEIRFKSFVGR